MKRLWRAVANHGGWLGLLKFCLWGQTDFVIGSVEAGGPPPLTQAQREEFCKMLEKSRLAKHD